MLIVTPTRRKSIVDVPEISRQLSGIAHVVRLKDGRTVANLRKQLPKYDCHDGALRLYWPHFQTKDRPEQHPLWPRPEKNNIVGEIFARVAEQSPRLLSSQPDIERLKQKRRELAGQSQTFLEKRQEATQQSLESEQEIAVLNALLGDADKEINEKTERLIDLEARLEKLRQDNRQLRWRVNTAWQQKDDRPVETLKENQLFLSANAKAIYDKMDAGEQHYWESNLLSKLLNEQLRNHQSEARHGMFVFPRQKSADGRRLFYFLQNEDVYVCALYRTHREYDQADRHIKPPDQYSGFRKHIIALHLLREDGPDYFFDDSEKTAKSKC